MGAQDGTMPEQQPGGGPADLDEPAGETQRIPPPRPRPLHPTLNLPLEERAGPPAQPPRPAGPARVDGPDDRDGHGHGYGDHNARDARSDRDDHDHHDEPFDPDNPPPAVDPWADAAPAWDPMWDPTPTAPPPTAPPTAAPPTAAPPALPVAPPPAPPRSLPATRIAPPVPTVPPVPARPAKRKDRRPPQPPHVPVPPPRGLPPGWTVPPGYELRRRRRRWPRRLTTLLLTFGLCCGCPAYFVVPMWQQYPASAAIPAEAAGYRRLTTREATRTERELERRAQEGHLFAEGTFAAVFNGGRGWEMTLYGTTGFRLAPKSDLEAEFTRLAEVLKVTEVREVEPGDLGGHQRCGFGTAADGDDLVVCGWADHGSLGVATFSAGSLEEDAETLRELRALVVQREG